MKNERPAFQSVTARESQWLVRYEARPAATLRLLCIPCAGAGAAAFRPWQRHVPEHVEIVTLQLPGRESRFRETPLRSAQCVTKEILPLIVDALPGPLVIFGHSMGSIVAFELARELERHRPGRLRHLFVAARGAPRIPVLSLKYALDNDAFREELESYGGTPTRVLEDHALMNSMLPTLRADFEITEAYRYVSGPKLRCPITVFAGLDDRLIPRETIAPWCQETESTCDIHWFEEGHFFVRDRAAELLGILLKSVGLNETGE